MKFFLLIVICLLSVFSSIAQNTLGLVVRDEKGKALEGATFQMIHSKINGVSNELGQITFPFVEDDILVIKYLGFNEFKTNIDKNILTLRTVQLTPATFSLDQVTIVQHTKTTNVVADIDLNIKPVSSSQEILRTVPGLFIGQHAGGGKAEQMFLRGFDIDHGTDVSVSVEGMPVNMVSHAHGQGYADLHFIIPETIENVDFGKGPYYADKGDFTTAAFVNFKLKEIFDQSSVGIDLGQYNSFRTSGLFNLVNTDKTKSYIATEYNLSDGWFESPQDFKRFNLFGRYQTMLTDRTKLSVSLSQFNSTWNASGQIPSRAVASGFINRFGSIDDTEGGKTNRQNALFHLNARLKNNLKIDQTAYLSTYYFNLFSNFTYFLNDPVHGDQINQIENRLLGGYQLAISKKSYWQEKSFSWKAGAGVRMDGINENQLSHTQGRISIIDRVRFGDIHEVNAYSFVDLEYDMGKLLINPSVRFDAFQFKYSDKLKTEDLKNSADKISPKLNFVYQANNDVQYFLKTGIGFHSNDARVVLQSDAREILPSAKGIDLGTNWKVSRKLLLSSALWLLDLNQEFVYVGDEGIVEPSGKTRRLGIDIGMRYQPASWLFFNFDYNYSKGRNKGELDNKYIPLAPVAASVGSMTLKQKEWGLSASYRYLSDRPANEDYTITAKGYFVNDLSAYYQIKKIRWHVRVENIFNVNWNETQFATLTRMQSEIDPVEEIHFTPGTPFFIKAGLTYNF